MRLRKPFKFFFLFPHSNSVNVNLYVRFSEGQKWHSHCDPCHHQQHRSPRECSISSSDNSLSFGRFVCHTVTLPQPHMCANIPMCLCQNALSTFHLHYLGKLLRNISGMMQPFCVTDSQKQRAKLWRNENITGITYHLSKKLFVPLPSPPILLDKNTYSDALYSLWSLTALVVNLIANWAWCVCGVAARRWWHFFHCSLQIFDLYTFLPLLCRWTL